MSAPVQALPQSPGDFDEDGVHTVLDLVRLINHIRGSTGNLPVSPGDPPGLLPAELRPFADLNDDGYLTATDVDILADAILGIPIPPIIPRPLISEPSSGASEVGVTVRPKITFPKPIDIATLNSNNFYASFAGQKLPTRIVPSNDGTFAWLSKQLSVFH